MTCFGQWEVSKHVVSRGWCSWAMPFSFCYHHEKNKFWAACWPRKIGHHRTPTWMELEAWGQAQASPSELCGANLTITVPLNFVFVPQQKLMVHTMPPLFYILYFKFCFSGFCPISFPGSPAPIHYDAF